MSIELPPKKKHFDHTSSSMSTTSTSSSSSVFTTITPSNQSTSPTKGSAEIIHQSQSNVSLSSSPQQTMKKKRIVIAVGNTKIGSIYFGKHKSSSKQHLQGSDTDSIADNSRRVYSNRMPRRSTVSDIKVSKSQSTEDTSLGSNSEHQKFQRSGKLSPGKQSNTVSETTEQSILISGLEYSSTQNSDVEKDLPHSNKEVIKHLHNKISRGIVSDLRKKETKHSAISTFQVPEELKTKLIEEYKNFHFKPYTEFIELTETMKNNGLPSLLPSTYATINVFHNLPIDEKLVNTPITDQTPSDKDITSELSLLLLSSCLKSTPYINEDEKSNTIIQNVIPIPGKELEISGSGSLKTFNWHTENVHEENPADYLILLALRGDKNAFTSFMLVEDIIATLPEQMLNDLLKTKFIMKTGPSYHKEKCYVRSILLKEQNGDYNIFYNSDINRCVPVDDFGKTLYERFQYHIETSVPCYAISLSAGEAVIIKNKEAMHKREGFEISTSHEERRWLQRIYLKNQIVKNIITTKDKNKV